MRKGLEGAGGETRGRATGTVRVQRSALTDLEPVRNGEAEEGESKNLTEVLMNTADPLGRIRGQTKEGSRQTQETVCGGN